MKTIRNLSTNDRRGKGSEISKQHVAVHGSKISVGSVEDKFPVTLDGGKTIIFISDKNKESETRKRYELRVSSRFAKYAKKP